MPIPLEVFAALLASSTLTEQDHAAGPASVRIETAGQVRILENGSMRLALPSGSVTFALADHADGSITLSTPGFVSERPDSNLIGGGLRPEQIVTGMTLSHEALSLSVHYAGGSAPLRTAGEDITVVLAQFN